jgi:hypothetical protein
MISFSRRYEAFVRLGKYLDDFSRNTSVPENNELKSLAEKLHIYNPWFIEPFVLKALELWAIRLSPESLQELINRYPQVKKVYPEKHVAVVPEDTVPFAGMSDLVAVLLAGCHFYGKNPNHQHDDLQFITDQLIAIEPGFQEFIHWSGFTKEIDTFLVHSKPSNEKAFTAYFEERHSLIRQKRVSLSIISEDDGAEVFTRLGDDIFTFFGLSPYNVRKLFVPKTFSIELFFGTIERFAWIYQQNRYANNYDYHKSVFLMDSIPFYDDGFLILRESNELQVPIGCLYYEYYDSLDDVRIRISTIDSEIQQVVTNLPEFPKAVKPGNAHVYHLWEFEDHQDTLQFLVE